MDRLDRIATRITDSIKLLALPIVITIWLWGVVVFVELVKRLK